MTSGENKMINDVLASKARLSNNDQNFIDMLAERDPTYYKIFRDDMKRLQAIHKAVTKK